MNKTKQEKEITWDTLKWKDVVINSDGEERMILGVLNDLVFISYDNEFTAHGSTRTKQELQNANYTIKQATPVEKVITVKGKRY